MCQTKDKDNNNCQARFNLPETELEQAFKTTVKEPDVRIPFSMADTKL